ncbi:uncharacterized protein ACBR49_019115 [Aulostomus maculatus]
MGKIYQVMVFGFKGEKMMVDLCNTEEQMKSMTVLQLKEKVSALLPTGQNVDNMRLIFVNRTLDAPYSLLTDYGIQHLSTLFLVIKVPGGLAS